MKFKVLYEYFEVIDADYFEPDCDSVRFVSEEHANHWIPKYMIKRIVPLKDDDDDSSR